MGPRPLGDVKDIVESIGMGISYAYEDLVFLEHNAFIFQFTDKDHEILVHINKEADMNEIGENIVKLKNAASDRGLVPVIGKNYILSKADDENIALEFLEAQA